MGINKVILIGASHYHGLNLARCFGEKGLRPYGIIVGNHGVRYVEASKYWEKVFQVETDEEAIHLLIDKFGNEKFSPVVIPWSDGAAAELDRNYNRLKCSFRLASIRGLEGEIGKWMNKDKQLELAQQLGLPMSPSKIIFLPLVADELSKLKSTLSLPLFLKPVTSCEGTKKDMRKINSWQELENYGWELAEKGFRRILVQEYMKIDMEYDFMGFCSNRDMSYTIAEKLRSWPTKGGAASFARVIDEKEKAVFFESIINKLKGFGYTGPFDMDIFQVGDKLYFNEINWRSSANVYAALRTGNNYPYRWFLAVTEHHNNEKTAPKCLPPDFYFMNEVWDFRHVLVKDITFGHWFSDFRKTKAFAFWDGNDIKPFVSEFIGAFVNRFKRRSSSGGHLT